MPILISRERILMVSAIILRVPGLFIIDYWWQYERNKSFPNSISITEIINAVSTNIFVLHGFLLLLLPLSHVKALYNHFLAACLIMVSHQLSLYYLALEKEDSRTPINMFSINYYQRQITLIICHIISSSIIPCLIDGLWKHFPLILGCYTLPIIARLAGIPYDVLQVLHNFSCAVVLISVSMYFTRQIPKVFDFLKDTYINVLVTANDHGIIAIASVLWDKLFVPNHFAVFWLIQFCAKLFRIMQDNLENMSSWTNEWYAIIVTTVSSICVSPISLVATAVAVSYLSFFVLRGTRAYLVGQLDPFADNPLHNGWTEGLTLILLSLQTGLSDTNMPERMAVMAVILFIVLSSLLQSMLEIVEPVILALSASRNRNLFRYLRALSVCLILLLFPLYLTWKLTTVFSSTGIDFWMMVVLSSCVLTSFHVIDILIVHGLFMYDSMQTEVWENLDDIVYYTRAITKVLEFFVAVVVVGRGLYESMSSKWNHVNTSILIVHCYFNVWQRLRTGWHSFLLRREAAQKVECLASATDEQLQQLDDVCCICYTSMRAACITRCQHYFHRNCLRKWLYVQDSCPLCHQKITLSLPVSEDLAGEEQQRHESES